MQRRFHTFRTEDIDALKLQMLNWANRFSICCFFDNHHYTSAHHRVECIVGAGAAKTLYPHDAFFDTVSTFVSEANDYVFCHFAYDVKNHVEAGLTSQHPETVPFPEACLFVPEVVLLLLGNDLRIGTLTQDPHEVYHAILNEYAARPATAPVAMQPRICRQQYIADVEALQRHIHLGDCYVINYCTEFTGIGTLDPVEVFSRLNTRYPNPFAAFYKLHHRYLLCASPERFIQKQGNTIISQPIKGTAPRRHDNALADEQSRQQLDHSAKDRSENVMVVDLVRNDFSRFCDRASVVVDELYGIYSYPNVHHMISTVKGSVQDRVPFGKILAATFPMGSMTGAPKRRVMELSEQYEHSKRGIYSGTVGYITPDYDFDFNVVIRSIVYDAESHRLSYHTGSAITAYSRPEDEYEECLLKGRSMQAILSGEK